MHLLAALPHLQTPNSHDIIGLLPELVMSGGFILVLLLDQDRGEAHRWLVHAQKARP